MPDTLKLKRATKSIANQSTKVLEKDEVLVITPDSGSGTGPCQLKFGDGVTTVKDQPIAIDGENIDNYKLSTMPTSSYENPTLSAGEEVRFLFGKIKKKFAYLENLLGNIKTVTNLFGSTDAKTVATGLQILVNTKFNKSDVYPGLDSTNDELAASSNALRQVNLKSDNNTQEISKLNSNLDVLEKALPHKAPALLEITKTDPSTCSLLFYNNGAGNWAGIGANNGGHVTMRIGLSNDEANLYHFGNGHIYVDGSLLI